MPRRSMLTAADRENLLALPQSDNELIRHYTFSETDRALIRLRRGDANRLGFAVQLCLLRYPGHALAADRAVPDVLIHWVAKELWLDTSVWEDYGERRIRSINALSEVLPAPDEQSKSAGMELPRANRVEGDRIYR